MLKTLRVPDPTDRSRLIQYAAVEGPEAAIYIRGIAELIGGRAVIELPEHFAVMASPGSITAQLTPRSASSAGLATVDVSPEQIEVRELFGGTGSYPFDYLVHAVRIGFEDQPVYLPTEEVEANGMQGLLQNAKEAAGRLATEQDQ